MIKINIYSAKIQLVIRTVSLLAIILLVVSNIKRALNYNIWNLPLNIYEFFSFLINCGVVFLFLGLFIFPTKIGVLSFISLIYGIQITVFEPENNMGIMMFGLSIITLYARGFFNKHKVLKKVIYLLIFLGTVFSEIRFGKEIFFSSLLEKLAYIFIFVLSLLFLQFYTFDIFKTNNSDKKLDIQKFSELKQRDAEWLAEILNGQKYEYLAIKSHMSIGSVKNRLKIIFEELGVGDKQGFLTEYSGYEICYGEDFSSITRNKFFNL